MKSDSNKTFNSVALISTPWPLYSRPSIQLGSLKAHLQSRFPDLGIDAHHFYLSLAETVGYKNYHEISQRTWLAESVYAALLFPNRLKQAKTLFSRESNRNSLLKTINFHSLTTLVKKTTDAFLDQHNWGRYGLIGFSISLCQLTSALYVIKRIKQRFPNRIIVIGGAAISGNAGHGVLDAFPEVDVVVNGEGELPLGRLIHNLRMSLLLDDIPKIRGVVTRRTSATKSVESAFLQIEALSHLPPPDYTDYFNLLGSLDTQQTFFPTLPVEISRGCWWKRTLQSGKVTGCAFCNLNLQWEGYRSKQARQVVSEIDHLTDQYKILSVAFTDNVLPKKESANIFKQLGKLKKDLRLFGEIRATTPWHELKSMHAAGMREVQIGIEALSSRLLKKLQKGTTTIQNLEIMKNCEALGIENISNLILQFPGSDQHDVAETLRTLEYAMPFRPLKAVNFWLGLGSPVWQNAKNYGIKAVYNHPNGSYLFPPKIYRLMPFMIQTYRGDLAYQRKIWKPVKDKIKEWQKIYTDFHQGPSHSPILSFQDGNEFIIIRQRRFQAESITHRLMGNSRSIYLFCQKHRSLKQIVTKFPHISEDKIVAFLKISVDKKLMFAEKGKYLSLAVPIRPEGK
jgi:ribosomal peptide maturation radical SAM protein 1